MGFGWAGNILRIDLSRKKIVREPTERYARQFIGGRGVNVKILFDEINPRISAFDKDNLLIFGVGPLAGASPLCSSRTEVTTKSPQLTAGFLGQSNFGGHFGSELVYAGFDHIVIRGIAEKPTYLWINNDEVELKDATHLWGKGCIETQATIQGDLADEDIEVAAIGPAGENRVAYASIVHQTSDAAGRMGTGAVMGSKMLKAVAVRGTGKIDVACPERLAEEVEEAYSAITSAPMYKELSTYGWSGSVVSNLKIGFGVVGNFELGYWEPLVKYGDGKFFVDKYAVKSVGCQGCPVRCMHFVEVPGVGAGVHHCLSYGSFTMPIWNHDTRFMFRLSQLCNHYGLDFGSVGGIIGWLTELCHRNILDYRDLDGIELRRGDKEAILTLVDKIVKREGIGNVLAEGTLKAARKIGKGSEEYVMHTRGMDKHPYEFRAFHGYALATSIASRGDVIRINPTWEIGYYLSTYDANAIRENAMKFVGKEKWEKALDPNEYEGKAEMVYYFENATIAVDCLSFCKHVIPYHISYSLEIPVNLYNAITGDEMTVDRILETSVKIRNIERAFEAREGLTRSDDTLPERFFTEPVSGGVSNGKILDRAKFEMMKDEYYALRKWNVETGNPERRGLEEQGLKWVADNLETYGALTKKSS